MKLHFWRIVFVAIFHLLYASTILSQTGFPGYYQYVALVSQADSLYQAGQYSGAAKKYLAANEVDVEKGIDVPVATSYYNAACSYSLARKAAKAFECLQVLAYKYDFMESGRMEADPDFEYLKKDPRWREILAQVKINEDSDSRHKTMIAKRTTMTTDSHEVIFYPLTPFAKQFLSQDSMAFISINHLIFRISFSADGYAAKHLDNVRAELTEAYDRAIFLLGISAYKRGINVVLFNAVEEMQSITGIRAQGGVAYAADDLAFFPYHSARRPQFRHELFHVMANNVWGYTYSRLLNEGSAVYADNQCQVENPIYGINAALLKSHKLFALRDLIEDFDGKARESDVIAYLQSAGIFKYLFEKHGIEKMKALWKNGFDHFRSIYGMSVTDFEMEWKQFIEGIQPPDHLDEQKLLKEGCG